ncbi:MAG TPA: c-type cytochrome [Chitinophagaceae bacterium]|jgi:cytochrome c|nr:c-type cytochrome [Chitinophagaceae bacterium]
MKKIVLPIIALALLTACGSNDAKEKGETTDNTNDITQNPDYQKGLALVTKNDCFTCHKIDETLTGPPYREVANKYAGMPDTIVQHLAKKVISGGAGVWGQVFMTPHPGVSEADAEAMVKYILLLKK